MVPVQLTDHRSGFKVALRALLLNDQLPLLYRSGWRVLHSYALRDNNRQRYGCSTHKRNMSLFLHPDISASADDADAMKVLNEFAAACSSINGKQPVCSRWMQNSYKDATKWFALENALSEAWAKLKGVNPTSMKANGHHLMFAQLTN